MNKVKLYVLGLVILMIGIVFCGFKSANSAQDAVKFYSPEAGIYIVDVDASLCTDCINPYVSDSLETVENIAKKTNATIAINTGFFDPKNKKTTSYIIQDEKLVADPNLNESLMENPKLQTYLPQILNRSEFRILDCGDKRCYQIAQHNTPVSEGCKIIHSIQAGPELVPELKLEEEVFVVKKDGKIIKESAGSLGRYARSAIAIKGSHILLVAVSTESPMTLHELAEYMKKLQVDQAMAFDGGSSTSLYVSLPGCKSFNLTSAKDNAARRIKSALLIKPE